MAHRRATQTRRRGLTAPPRHWALITSPVHRELRPAGTEHWRRGEQRRRPPLDAVVAVFEDSGRAPAVGDKCHMTRRIGGADRSSTSVLTHIDPPHTWGVRGIDGPIRATVDLTVEPIDDTRGRLTIAVDFTGHGIGKLLVPLVVHGQARKEMPANLDRLKTRLETGAAADTERG
jgi:hypothetical protein